MPSDIQPDLVVTAVSYSIQWLQPEANRQAVEQLLPTLPKRDIILLPETFTTGFGLGMEKLAEPPSGPTLQWMHAMARQYGAMMVATWIVRQGDQCFNRLHLITPEGDCHTYDKAHTFRPSGESTIIARGRQRTVVEWRGWRLRPAVCYDLRFPTWLRNSNTPNGRLAYDLLLVCANWPSSRQAAWDTLLRARAIENLCYAAGCNCRGTDPSGATYIGGSALIDHKGTPLATDSNSHYATATFHLHDLHHFRQRWPFHLDFD